MVIRIIIQTIQLSICIYPTPPLYIYPTSTTVSLGSQSRYSKPVGTKYLVEVFGGNYGVFMKCIPYPAHIMRTCSKLTNGHVHRDMHVLQHCSDCL